MAAYRHTLGTNQELDHLVLSSTSHELGGDWLAIFTI